MPATNQEPRYDVFISYRRRTAADDIALLLQLGLQRHSLSAFLDRRDLRGVFDDMLLRRIAESPAFLVILTPGSLDHCNKEDDWLRKEILHAIRTKRNIVPLQVDSFQFTGEVLENLDPAMRELARYHMVEYSRAYFHSTIELIAKIVEEDKAERAEAQEAERTERQRLAMECDDEQRKEQPRLVTEHEALEMAQREDQKLAEQRRQIAANPEPFAMAGKEKWELPKQEAGIAISTGEQNQWRSPWRKPLLLVGMAVVAMIVVVVGLQSRGPSGPQSGPDPAPLTRQLHLPAATVPGAVTTNPQDNQKYVWIPSGTFQMGCSVGDNECYPDEKPAHWVTIKKDFWLGQTLVTQAAYQQLMGHNPSHYHGDLLLPVEMVTWNQAKSYCEEAGGRLPKEDEWEFAERAGSNAPRYGDLNAISWHWDNSSGKTHEVARKQANPFGLYDMLGNVWEWVEDWYDDKGEFRVIRGGSFGTESRDLRSSVRFNEQAWAWSSGIGFRCVLEVP